MPGFTYAPSILSFRSVAAQRAASLRRSAAHAVASLLVVACGAPAQLDLGYDDNALQGPDDNGTPVVVDPSTLQATIGEIVTEGVLCPPGSVASALSPDGAAASVSLSEAVSGVQTAGCVLTFQLDVPEGLALGMPTTILRGFSLGYTQLERHYSFEGADAPASFVFQVAGDDFVISERTSAIESASCGASRRVSYKVDVTAQLLEAEAFFQLDSVDLDTAFRSGTQWRFCDPSKRLVIAAGESGDFCDGPNARACAEGLVCDRAGDPNSEEGVCAAP